MFRVYITSKIEILIMQYEIFTIKRRINKCKNNTFYLIKCGLKAVQLNYGNTILIPMFFCLLQHCKRQIGRNCTKISLKNWNVMIVNCKLNNNNFNFLELSSTVSPNLLQLIKIEIVFFKFKPFVSK